jgi:hypothetical protein
MDERLRNLLILGPVLVTGLAGTGVALSNRGAESEFLQTQEHPPKLRPVDVERVVRTAPDPALGKGSGISATCEPLGRGPLRNPWRCVVEYRSGRKIRIVVRIAKEDGSYTGRYAGGGAASGCCVVIPGSE